MIGLRSSALKNHETAVLNEMTTLGGNILSIGEEDATVSFHSGVDEQIRNILYLPFGQMVAFERSLAKGLNPDLPNNLDAVVKL